MNGLIVWHELYTDDVDAAAGFYTELLGLELETADLGDFQYAMLKKDGRTHAGFVRTEQAGVPSHWYPYVQVEDVDGTLGRAKGLGAELRRGPMDVGDGLRIAVLDDPQGATFGVMRWSEDPPQGVFAWDELDAADVEEAARFYGEIAGWTTSPSFQEGYRLFDAVEAQAHVAGLMRKPDEMPAAAWNAYFAVGDVDGTVARAQELGARELVSPTSMEKVGRFAILADPGGAPFGLFAGES